MRKKRKKKVKKISKGFIKKEILLQLLLIVVIFNLVFLLNFVDIIRESAWFLVLIIIGNWIGYYVSFRLFSKGEIMLIIGKKQFWRNILWGVLFFVVVVILLISGLLQLLQKSLPSGGFDFTYVSTLALIPAIILFFKIITAGITEEFIFRGFVMTRLRNIAFYCFPKANQTQVYLLHIGFGILISSILYGLSYWWTGLLGMVTMFILGIILCFSYFASRSIHVPIIVHLLYSFFVMTGFYRHLTSFLTSKGLFPLL